MEEEEFERLRGTRTLKRLRVQQEEVEEARMENGVDLKEVLTWGVSPRCGRC